MKMKIKKKEDKEDDNGEDEEALITTPHYSTVRFFSSHFPGEERRGQRGPVKGLTQGPNSGRLVVLKLEH